MGISGTHPNAGFRDETRELEPAWWPGDDEGEYDLGALDSNERDEPSKSEPQADSELNLSVTVNIGAAASAMPTAACPASRPSVGRVVAEGAARFPLAANDLRPEALFRGQVPRL